MSEDIDDWLNDDQPNETRKPNESRGRGCLFPGRCCMPGEHMKFECYTPEMIEGAERQP